VLFGAPLLLLHSNAADASRTKTTASAGHGAPKHVVSPASHPNSANFPSNLVAYQAPGTATTTTLPPTTTTLPPTTTTTVQAPVTTTTLPPPPPPPTTTTTRPAPSNSEVGDATWYAAAPAGYCASPTLPFGTELTVVNDATGASTVCTVDDREAAGYPRVVDLSPEGFGHIADMSEGVVRVTISW
jgi:rare lipoprotein A (peptidoglycan hydrolase)